MKKLEVLNKKIPKKKVKSKHEMKTLKEKREKE